jgi:hypothetical protein
VAVDVEVDEGGTHVNEPCSPDFVSKETLRSVKSSPLYFL